MENFEKCTVAMLGGPCSQHVTGNTSWLNQPQSAIILYKIQQLCNSHFQWTVGKQIIMATKEINIDVHQVHETAEKWLKINSTCFNH